MSVSDDLPASPAYIKQQMRLLESKESELSETLRAKKRSEFIAFFWNAGAAVAQFFNVPIPTISAGLVDTVWQTVKQWMTKGQSQSAVP